MSIFKVFKKQEPQKQNSTDRFMNSLKKLSQSYFPYKDPMMFHDFSLYSSIDKITFYVPVSTCKNRSSLVEKTGLKTIKYGFESSGGLIHWEASYAEYKSVFQSDTAMKYKSTSSMLISIFETVSRSKSDYIDFIERYAHTVENIYSIVDKYGTSFIMSNKKIDESLTQLVMSFISEYTNYGLSIDKHKENEVLRMIEIEQTFVDISIENSLYALEYKEDFSLDHNK